MYRRCKKPRQCGRGWGCTAACASLKRRPCSSCCLQDTCNTHAPRHCSKQAASKQQASSKPGHQQKSLSCHKQLPQQTRLGRHRPGSLTPTSCVAASPAALLHSHRLRASINGHVTIARKHHSSCKGHVHTAIGLSMIRGNPPPAQCVVVQLTTLVTRQKKHHRKRQVPSQTTPRTAAQLAQLLSAAASADDHEWQLSRCAARLTAASATALHARDTASAGICSVASAGIGTAMVQGGTTSSTCTSGSSTCWHAHAGLVLHTEPQLAASVYACLQHRERHHCSKRWERVT
jgi:hypothetical protein